MYLCTHTQFAGYIITFLLQGRLHRRGENITGGRQ